MPRRWTTRIIHSAGRLMTSDSDQRRATTREDSMAGKDFDAFKQVIEQKFMGHPVVTRNEYTAWFAHGEMPLDHLRRFTVQFSVFSNQFLLAALNRVINADTLQSARESKEILMNELGVIYNKGGKGAASDAATA